MNEELTKLFEEFKAAHAEFQRKNDERLAEVEKKGRADGLLTEQVEKLNGELTRLQGEISELNTRANRAPSVILDAKGNPIKQLSAEEIEHRAEVISWIRKGKNEEKLREMEKKSGMSSGSDEDGGFLLARPTVGMIVTRVYETTPLRQYANVETISTDGFEYPLDLGEADSGWVGETQDRGETNTPKVGMGKIAVHEIFAQPKQTQRFLDDAAVDVEKWLANKVVDRFARQENRAFAQGDGVIMPAGIFTKPSAATADATRTWGVLEHRKTGVNATLGATPGDTLIDVVYSLKAAYRARAAFMMPRLVEAEVRKIKDGEGRYIWQPGLQMGVPSSLLGYPVIEAEDAPAMAAGSKSLAFGDFHSGYTIVDRIGVRVLRDPYTQKGWIKFYTTKRVGGDVTNYEAIKLLMFAA